MRRADRLFQIVQRLRARRLTTAAQLAEWLGTSERTIYRDIRDLSTSGVPVRGEAGVGYQIDRSFDLTPLMFSRDEVEAVVVGVRMVGAFGGPTLRKAALSALNKVALALPDRRRSEIEEPQLYAIAVGERAALGDRIELMRQAITGLRKIDLEYRNERDERSQRVVRPLGLYFWGTVWILAAWCELRDDFRSFRVDRMDRCTVLDRRFVIEEGKGLQEFLATVGVQNR